MGGEAPQFYAWWVAAVCSHWCISE